MDHAEQAPANGSLEAQTLIFSHLPWERLPHSSAEQQKATLTSVAKYAEALSREPQKDFTQWLEAAEACLKVTPSIWPQDVIHIWTTGSVFCNFQTPPWKPFEWLLILVSMQILVGMSALGFEASEDASFLVIAMLTAVAKNCSLEVSILADPLCQRLS